MTRFYGITDEEIGEMFGVGNFEDYWLNWYPVDDRPGWKSAEVFVKGLSYEQDSEDSAFEAMMRHDPGGRGGGLQGDTPELHLVRDGLLRDGTVALEWERKFNWRDRR
jgi:hypothetical protein